MIINDSESTNENIKDNELLTLSNLTNLEWQFLQMNLDDESESKLNKLLKPESFIRKDEENPDIVKYIYSNTELSEGEELTPEQIEEGIDEMRKKAPVAMNYLEECGKNSGEGDFLTKWEAYVS